MSSSDSFLGSVDGRRRLRPSYQSFAGNPPATDSALYHESKKGDINPAAYVAFWLAWGFLALCFIVQVASFFELKTGIDESEGTPEDHVNEVKQWDPLWQVAIAEGILLFVLAVLNRQATNLIFTCNGSCDACVRKSNRAQAHSEFSLQTVSVQSEEAKQARPQYTGYNRTSAAVPRQPGGGRHKRGKKNTFGKQKPGAGPMSAELLGQFTSSVTPESKESDPDNDTDVSRAPELSDRFLQGDDSTSFIVPEQRRDPRTTGGGSRHSSPSGSDLSDDGVAAQKRRQPEEVRLSRNSILAAPEEEGAKDLNPNKRVPALHRRLPDQVVPATTDEHTHEAF